MTTIHGIKGFESSTVSRIITTCCSMPIKQISYEQSVTTDLRSVTCDGTPERRRTSFGDSTLADNPKTSSDIEIVDKYGKRLLIDDSLNPEGLTFLTSGDGVDLDKEAVLKLSHKLIKRCS